MNNTWVDDIPRPPKHLCTEPDKMCDFQRDCAGAEDEAKCGETIHPVNSVLLSSAGLPRLKRNYDLH